MRRTVLTALVVLTAACDPEPPPIEPPVEASVSIGLVSADGFAKLSDGVELELIPGAQGGFHVTLDTRVNMPGEVTVKREIRRDDTGELVARSQVRSDVARDGALMVDLPMFLCPAPVGINIADETLEVTYRIESEAGTQAMGRLAFIPRCPSSEGEAFCDKICRR